MDKMLHLKKSVMLREEFKNWDKISLMAQPFVEDLVSQCKKFPCVERMYVFGSAIRPDWTYAYSDIDVYLEGCASVDVRGLRWSSEFIQRMSLSPSVNPRIPIDILCEHDEYICGSEIQKIMKAGVLVYER